MVYRVKSNHVTLFCHVFSGTIDILSVQVHHISQRKHFDNTNCKISQLILRDEYPYKTTHACNLCTLLEKKGSLAVSMGEPFEEPSLHGTQKGSSKDSHGDSQRTLLEPFFSKSVGWLLFSLFGTNEDPTKHFVSKQFFIADFSVLQQTDEKGYNDTDILSYL